MQLALRLARQCSSPPDPRHFIVQACVGGGSPSRLESAFVELSQADGEVLGNGWHGRRGAESPVGGAPTTRQASRALHRLPAPHPALALAFLYPEWRAMHPRTCFPPSPMDPLFEGNRVPLLLWQARVNASVCWLETTWWHAFFFFCMKRRFPQH